jgi:hypothetical protein
MSGLELGWHLLLGHRRVLLGLVVVVVVLLLKLVWVKALCLVVQQS